MDSCIFCKIIAGEIPSKKVYEDDLVLAFEDIAPKAKVHVLITPKKHYQDVVELSNDPKTLAHLAEIAGDIASGKLIHAGSELSANLFEDGGFTLIFNTKASAGQTVFHAHGHILAGEGFPNPTA
ncbi:MAG: HIT domain-containing protein [Candidatus Ancillula sp.]|jgi:histidine triad (HIT) family protein|nr:HIT domain-containing protein [Candidatus Ancillula sp.]